MNKVKKIIRVLQPKARIIETNYGKVEVKDIINSNAFNLEEACASAGWAQELEKEVDEEDHEHNNHHHEDEGELEEYGIGTFVYFRRKPFNRARFEDFANRFPKEVIRCKGLIWFSDTYNESYIFEQAGKQIQASYSGDWIASAPKNELDQIIKENPEVLREWDSDVGDRMIKLVFIGQNMNKKEIIDKLDQCIEIK